MRTHNLSYTRRRDHQQHHLAQTALHSRYVKAYMRGDNCKRCVSFSSVGSLAGALLQKPNDLAGDLLLLLLLVLMSNGAYIPSAHATKPRQQCCRCVLFCCDCAVDMQEWALGRKEAHRSHARQTPEQTCRHSAILAPPCATRFTTRFQDTRDSCDGLKPSMAGRLH